MVVKIEIECSPLEWALHGLAALRDATLICSVSLGVDMEDRERAKNLCMA